MRRATLLYNPVAGKPGRRITDIERIAEALRKQNLDITITATEGPSTAGAQAASSEADILFACGGDGTIHEVIQGLVHHPHTALGIIPMGSANALARHLKLSMNPLHAARQQLSRKAGMVPLGWVSYQMPCGERSRYFIAMAGAGADGALVYKMLGAQKHRFGRLSYYLRAAKLACRTPFSAFAVTCTEPSGETTTQRAVSAMSVRIGNLGGLFAPLVRGGDLHHPCIRVTTVKPPAFISFSAWFALSCAGLHRWNTRVDTRDVLSFNCAEGETSSVQVQADGEWLGRTPMTVTLVPAALRLLLPG